MAHTVITMHQNSNTHRMLHRSRLEKIYMYSFKKNKKKLIHIDTNVCSKMTLILICFQMVEDLPILIIQTLTSALFLQVLRIAQELSSLSTSLPLELSSSIFVRTVSKFWTSIYLFWLYSDKKVFIPQLFSLSGWWQNNSNESFNHWVS